uniref:Protein TsetseEP domain-containing protein n=1 Tax=Anopheles christyi TaxID=43041 RepID=A0A182JR99_9DIPT
MKSIIVLVAIVGIAAAGRPDTERVITTFKQIAPLYKPTIQEAQTIINAIKSNATNQLAELHLAIIGKKEGYVQQVIGREDYILQQISTQRSADQVCMSFVRTSSEMNVNLAGVSFTNCINAADEAIKTKLEEYYGYMGDYEQKVSLLRLLDVFQGQNVFHSPQPIIARLNAKMEALRNSSSLITENDAQFMINQVRNDMQTIQLAYSNCMGVAYGLLGQGLNMCEMQMTMICGAVLSCDIGKGMGNSCADVNMKLLVCVVLLLAGGSYAGRPGAQEVIEKFRAIVPGYLAAMGKDQQQLVTLERQGTDAIAQFHSDIMLAKETFVLSITGQEDTLIGLINAQNRSIADGQCMQFVSTALNETVNVIGVAYTKCINAADESLSSNISSYYGTIGELEQAVVDVRLLDVFRGDNVFYTPDSIVAKLRQKESELNANNSTTVAGEMREEIAAFQADLAKIRERYIGCMTVAEMSFRSYMELARQQLAVICGALLENAPNDVAA